MGEQDVAEAMARVGREVIRLGLTWGSSGNLSARTGDGAFLISAAGARLDELTPAALARCWIQDPPPRAAGRERGRARATPSVEVEMHRAVYAAVPEAEAVLHTSAPYTTLLACSRLRVPVNMNTDAMAFVGRVLRVPYRHPGTRDLAVAAAGQAPKARALLLSNHGSLVWDAGLDAVLRRTEALEFLARLVVTARGARVSLASLSAEDVARFRGHDPR